MYNDYNKYPVTINFSSPDKAMAFMATEILPAIDSVISEADLSEFVTDYREARKAFERATALIQHNDVVNVAINGVPVEDAIFIYATTLFYMNKVAHAKLEGWSEWLNVDAVIRCKERLDAIDRACTWFFNTVKTYDEKYDKNRVIVMPAYSTYTEILGAIRDKYYADAKAKGLS